jgi:hypothetical protein
VSRAGPGVLRVGDRVCLDSVARTVVGFAGTTVLLADENGSVITPDLAFVCSRGVFGPAPAQVGGGLASGLLAGIAAPAAERARWWERHVLEVITGRDPDGAAPRPEYDLQTHSMADREAAKATELSRDGEAVSAFTVRRKRQRYETRGLAGLVDGRSTRARPPQGRTDPRVAEELRRLIDASTESASRTVEFFRWKVEQQLTAAHGPGEVVMPSRAASARRPRPEPSSMRRDTDPADNQYGSAGRDQRCSCIAHATHGNFIYKNRVSAGQSGISGYLVGDPGVEPVTSSVSR